MFAAPLAAGLLLTGFAMPAWAVDSAAQVAGAPAATVQAADPKGDDTAKTSIVDVKVSAPSEKGEQVKSAKDWGLKAGDYTTGVWKVDDGHDKLTMHVYDKDGKTVVATGKASKDDTTVKFVDKDGKPLTKVTLADDTTVGFTGFGTVSFEYTPATTTTPTVKGDVNGDGKADAKDLKAVVAKLADKDGKDTGKYVAGFNPTGQVKDVKIPVDQTVTFEGTPDGWSIIPSTPDKDGRITVTATPDGGTPITWTFLQSKDATTADKPTTPDTDTPAVDPFAGFTDEEKATLNTVTVTDDKGNPVDWFKASQLEYWKLTPDQFKQAPSVGIGGGTPGVLEAASNGTGYYDKDGNQLDINEDGTAPKGAVTWKYVIKGKTSGKTVTYVFSTLDKPATTDKPNTDKNEVDVDTTETGGMKSGNAVTDFKLTVGTPYTVTWKPATNPDTGKPDAGKISIGTNPRQARTTDTPATDATTTDDTIRIEGTAPAEGGAFTLTEKATGAVQSSFTVDETTFIAITGYGVAVFTPVKADTNQSNPEEKPADQNQNKPGDNKLPQTGVAILSGIIALGTATAGGIATILSKRKHNAE